MTIDDYNTNPPHVCWRNNAWVRFALLLVFCVTIDGLFVFTEVHAEPRHAIAMHGEAKLKPDFKHFAYANPDAPQGGALRIGVVGTFHSLNPFNLGTGQVRQVAAWTFQSLMTRSYDEPFTLYPALASLVETPDERNWVEFTLNENARFADGKPVTATDVLMSWELLRDHGRPNHRRYYSKVAKAEIKGERVIRFVFHDGTDRELPLIIGLMPILSAHATDMDTFDQASLVGMVGSGPYQVSEVVPGHKVIFHRNPDFWANDEAFARGVYNFETIELIYYRDVSALVDAFRLNKIDYRGEGDPKEWANYLGFDEEARKRIYFDEVKTGLPKGMYGIVLNLRKAKFANPLVREALIDLFDFAYLNQALFGGAYHRQVSYFEDSELSARGRPADDKERDLLKNFPDAVAPDIMEGRYHPPQGDGTAKSRKALRSALQRLRQAGLVHKDGQWFDRNGEPFGFELLVSGSHEESIALAFQAMVGRADIPVAIRLLEPAGYQERLKTFDYDAIVNRWYASLSPGNEQYFYWSADARDEQGSRNYMGFDEPAIAAMIDALVGARERATFVSAVRALDRVLMSGKAVVPLYYAPHSWIARWKGLEKPKHDSLFGFVLETWWREPL